MTREDLLKKYQDYGKEWHVSFFKREFAKIDNAKSKDKAFEQINWWGEYYENLFGNINLSQAEHDKAGEKSYMYAELAYLDEFN